MTLLAGSGKKRRRRARTQHEEAATEAEAEESSTQTAAESARPTEVGRYFAQGLTFLLNPTPPPN
jgi:hypothetical protein